jgi:hypothetical protein
VSAAAAAARTLAALSVHLPASAAHFPRCGGEHRPKGIPVRVITEMNREFVRSKIKEKPLSAKLVDGHG